MSSDRLKISKGGQISLPARVRHRWRAEAVVAEDHGDYVLLRPEDIDPVAAFAGAFEYAARRTADDLKEEDRQVELEAELRRNGEL